MPKTLSKKLPTRKEEGKIGEIVLISFSKVSRDNSQPGNPPERYVMIPIASLIGGLQIQGDKKTCQSVIFARNNTDKFTKICI